MADASDSKSDGGDLVWVQVPPSALRMVKKKIATDLTVGSDFLLILIYKLFLNYQTGNKTNNN